jgi:hypothetical protein
MLAFSQSQYGVQPSRRTLAEHGVEDAAGIFVMLNLKRFNCVFKVE